MLEISRIRAIIAVRRHRSAWDLGVKLYASDLLDSLEEAVDAGWIDVDDLRSPKMLRRALLNGADDWRQYSEGGCSLIRDREIAERLCTPSELKRTHHGERSPNGRETWLDVQARALYHAEQLIVAAVQSELERSEAEVIRNA